MTTTPVDQAINAWRLCPEAKHYSHAIDCVRLATWRGVDIAWLGFDSESFDIVRLDGSGVVDIDDLDTCEALDLSWRVYRITPPLVLSMPTENMQ